MRKWTGWSRHHSDGKTRGVIPIREDGSLVDLFIPQYCLMQDSNEREPVKGAIRAKLWRADYAIATQRSVIGIERKAGDLASSYMKRARQPAALKTQLHDMQALYDIVVLLWEGNPQVDPSTRKLRSGPKVHRNRHMSLRNFVLNCGVAWGNFILVPTANWQESADWLMSLPTYLKKGVHYDSGQRVEF